MKTMILAALAALLVAVPASAQLNLAPGGGMSFAIVDGEDGTKEAKRIGDMLQKIEYQFSMDEYGRHFVGVLGFYDGADFGGFGLRYYRNMMDTGVYPLFGVNLSVLNDGREYIDELSIFGGIELGLEIWVPGPEETSFPLTISSGIRKAIVGTDIYIVPVEFAVPLGIGG
ncbi:MAG: hypothetical protein GY838_13715 [bacterium]|nr:hypothetical protein [bacterium]